MAWSNRTGLGGWRVFGIPILVDPSWFVIVVWVAWTLAHGYFPSGHPGWPPTMYWLTGAIAAVLLFGCVLLHELGHSLVAKRVGIPVTQVTLFIFGGVAQLGQEPRRPQTELLIALAGPMVSVALAWGCSVLGGTLPAETLGQEAVVAILRYLGFVNVALLCFNLLPGFPLDGGRVLRALLWAWTGSLRKATRVASLAGAGLGWGLAGLGIWALLRGARLDGLWYIVLGLFLRGAARNSYRRAGPAPRSEAGA